MRTLFGIVLNCDPVHPSPVLDPDFGLPMLPLSLLGAGRRACVAFLGGSESDAQRLRDLGLREGAFVCVMRNTDKCVLAMDGCRLALGREVAAQVFATELA